MKTILFKSPPAEAEDDGTLVLLDSLEAEPDGDGEGDRHQDHREHLQCLVGFGFMVSNEKFDIYTRSKMK